MFITTNKTFFKDASGNIHACAIVEEHDIHVHETFDDALNYHQKQFDYMRKQYGDYFTKSPRINFNDDRIWTIFEYVTPNGNYRKIELTTIKKNYGD